MEPKKTGKEAIFFKVSEEKELIVHIHFLLHPTVTFANHLTLVTGYQINIIEVL